MDRFPRQEGGRVGGQQQVGCALLLALEGGGKSGRPRSPSRPLPPSAAWWTRWTSLPWSWTRPCASSRRTSACRGRPRRWSGSSRLSGGTPSPAPLPLHTPRPGGRVAGQGAAVSLGDGVGARDTGGEERGGTEPLRPSKLEQHRAAKGPAVPHLSPSAGTSLPSSYVWLAQEAGSVGM